MLCGVFVLGLITAADVPTGAADSQMKPFIALSKTFLAAERAGLNAANSIQMSAIVSMAISILRPRRPIPEMGTTPRRRTRRPDDKFAQERRPT